MEDNIKCVECDDAEHIICDFSSGYNVCTNCGVIQPAILFDNTPEWRNYDDDKGDSSRCSLPINSLLPQSSLGTNISGWKSRVKTLHDWNAMPYEERSNYEVFKEIQDKCSKNQILKCVIDDAQHMFKLLSECKHISGKNKGKKIITRGANRKSLIAACIYFSCKKKGETRSKKELADMFEIKSPEISDGLKTCRKMIKTHGSSLNININLGPSHASDFINRIGTVMNIPKRYIQFSIMIADNLHKLDLVNEHTPYTMAPGCLLLMAKINNLHTVDIETLSEKFGISVNTITKIYDKIKMYEKIITNNNITNMIDLKIKKELSKKEIPEDIKKKIASYNIY